MLLNYFSNMTVLVIASIVMIMALIFHNVFQTWVAARLGDHSPRLAGFGAFDPGRQLDGFGIILLLTLGLLRPMKGVLINQQYNAKAEEARHVRD